ncbi:hypothetical protein [Flavobacterium sp.]|uniref:hypothetical protein n=1 Tax=Flavobacterium sp. TaxID=239 RepID=UPI0025E10067|nr:hypothetical protein [Flavobacterium sp.]
MKSTRRPYRKHKVKINDNYITVKDWMRNNGKYFDSSKGVPTSNQIGTVLVKNGFNRIETETEVIYK